MIIMLITMIIMLFTIMINMLIAIMIIMLFTVLIAVINILITLLIPLQAALLYTDSDRRRRIRVINRQMKVVDDLPPLAASVSRAYLGHISGISRAHLSARSRARISDISRTYLGHISDISRAHLGAISPRRSIHPPS